jgi:hypothetical protein
MVNPRVGLAGFVGDFIGNEEALVKALPVFIYKRRQWVALRDDRTIENGARPLRGRELAFVNRLPWLRRPRIQAGDLVWLAGPDLIDSCLKTSALRGVGLVFRDWAPFSRGFTYSFGSQARFLEQANSLYDTSKRSLLRALFDRELPRLEAGLAEHYFKVFENGRYYDDDVDYLATSALYYYCVRDRDRYDLTRLMAVESGAFDCDSSFDKYVRARIAEYQEPRPNENPRSRRRIVIENQPLPRQRTEALGVVTAELVTGNSGGIGRRSVPTVVRVPVRPGETLLSWKLMVSESGAVTATTTNVHEVVGATQDE